MRLNYYSISRLAFLFISPRWTHIYNRQIATYDWKYTKTHKLVHCEVLGCLWLWPIDGDKYLLIVVTAFLSIIVLCRGRCKEFFRQRRKLVLLFNLQTYKAQLFFSRFKTLFLSCEEKTNKHKTEKSYHMLPFVRLFKFPYLMKVLLDIGCKMEINLIMIINCPITYCLILWDFTPYFSFFLSHVFFLWLRTEEVEGMWPCSCQFLCFMFCMQ